MAASSSKSPGGWDAPKGSSSQWNRGRSSGFEWVSPAPSPVEIAELERLFPDIVQAPKQALQEEIDRWRLQAVFVRSLGRWIPPEILVRELHRAGIRGEIEAIALANRHYLLRFADASALPLVLGRPWVVNGQVLAITEWKENFIPSEQSIGQALIWIRLPLLPIEFWSDEILASILEVAGQFQFSDEATRNRKRGSYARACVAINLSKPLRPGARIRGSGNPFWQQFCFENLDGICSKCGSLHASDGCGDVSNSEVPSSPLVFGPWMAAVRRRRPPQVPSSANAASPVSGVTVNATPSQSDGWQLPKKVARRQLYRGVGGKPSSSVALSNSLVAVSNLASGGTVVAGSGPLLQTGLQSAGGVPGGGNRAGLTLEVGLQGPSTHLIEYPGDLKSGGQGGALVPVGKQKISMEPETQALVTVPIRTANLNGPSIPFRELRSQGAGHLGPAKRARPADLPVLRVASKGHKAKGKAQLRDTDCAPKPFTFAASKDPSSASRAQKSRRKDCLGTRATSGMVLSDQEDGPAHEAAVALLKGAILHDCSLMVRELPMVEDGSVTDPSGLPDNSDQIEKQMTGDAGGVPLPPQ